MISSGCADAIRAEAAQLQVAPAVVLEVAQHRGRELAVRVPRHEVPRDRHLGRASLLEGAGWFRAGLAIYMLVFYGV